jgi:hypothetical protein
VALSVTGINPDSGGAGTNVAVIGTGFTSDITLALTDEGAFTAPLDNVVYIDSTEAAGDVPSAGFNAGQVYTVEVGVDGSTAMLHAAFTYTASDGTSPTLTLQVGSTRIQGSASLEGGPPGQAVEFVFGIGQSRQVHHATTDSTGAATVLIVPPTPGPLSCTVELPQSPLVLAGPVTITVAPS